MDNAYTADNCTVYHYDIANGQLRKSLDMFGAIFEQPLLSEGGVDNEKNVNCIFYDRLSIQNTLSLYKMMHSESNS